MNSGPLPDDLGIAIKSRFLETQDLVDGFPGGIFRAKADPKPAGSQLVFRILNARQSFLSEDTEFLRKVVRFTVFSGDSNEAGSLRQKVEDAYEGKPIEHALGWTTPWEVSDLTEDEVSKPADPNNMAYKAVVDFMFHEHQGP